LVLLAHPATQAKAAMLTALMANRWIEFILVSPWDFGCELAIGLFRPANC
jgi:hypothetical protein